MYAVIKTGGKQYRVQPGDLLVVEKLDGDVGANVAFDQVLMVAGDGGEVTLGAPTVAGAVVNATLIETRKGEKIKIFKKIRRQGYRRTRGHRQTETVLRVTGLEGAGLSAKWDGTVDLTPRSVLNARARGLASREDAAAAFEAPAVPAPKAETKAAPKAKAAAPAAETVAEEAAPAPKKAKAPKAEAAQTEAPAAETPAAEAAPKKPRAKKAAAPEGEGGEA